jgi:hypothetical protein
MKETPCISSLFSVPFARDMIAQLGPVLRFAFCVLLLVRGAFEYFESLV